MLQKIFPNGVREHIFLSSLLQINQIINDTYQNYKKIYFTFVSYPYNTRIPQSTTLRDSSYCGMTKRDTILSIFSWLESLGKVLRNIHYQRHLVLLPTWLHYFWKHVKHLFLKMCFFYLMCMNVLPAWYWPHSSEYTILICLSNWMNVPQNHFSSSFLSLAMTKFWPKAT